MSEAKSEKSYLPELHPNPDYDITSLEEEIREQRFLELQTSRERSINADEPYRSIFRSVAQGAKKDLEGPIRWAELTNLTEYLPFGNKRNHPTDSVWNVWYDRLWEDMDRYLRSIDLYDETKSLHDRELVLLTKTGPRRNFDNLTKAELEELQKIQNRMTEILTLVFIELRRKGYSYSDLRRTGPDLSGDND